MGERLGRRNGGECLSLGGGRTKKTSLKQALSTVVPCGGPKILFSEWCKFKYGCGNRGEPESQSDLLSNTHPICSPHLLWRLNFSLKAGTLP